MNLLAIETSCEHGSVAVRCGDELLERAIEGNAAHSEQVLPLILELLAEAGLAVGQLDAVAFGSGPGAFTGLRLACGLAQGLALGAGLGVAPVVSLEALALQEEGEHILVATDARMGEIYHAAYLRAATGLADGRLLQTIAAPACCAPADFVAPAGDWAGIGSAFGVYERELAHHLGPRLLRARALAAPRAREVSALGASALARGELLPPELATPLYVRDKVAFTTAERLARGGRA